MKVSEMKIKLAILAALLAVSQATAETCNTNCPNQCRVKLEPPRICSPWGGCVQLGGGAEFLDPTCNAKCEALKRASCATGVPLPTVPLSPREIISTVGTAVCTLPNNIVLQSISSRCGFIPAHVAARDSVTIERAKRLLLSNQVLKEEDFKDVSIQFCNSIGGVAGIVPDRDRVYLNSSFRDAESSPERLVDLAALLAHEMFHVIQYRVWGTDKFKCDYTRQYIECGQCSDRGNSIERSAYEFEDRTRLILRQRLNANNTQVAAPPQTPAPPTPAKPQMTPEDQRMLDIFDRAPK